LCAPQGTDAAAVAEVKAATEVHSVWVRGSQKFESQSNQNWAN